MHDTWLWPTWWHDMGLLWLQLRVLMLRHAVENQSILARRACCMSNRHLPKIVVSDWWPCVLRIQFTEWWHCLVWGVCRWVNGYNWAAGICLIRGEVVIWPPHCLLLPVQCAERLTWATMMLWRLGVWWTQVNICMHERIQPYEDLWMMCDEE